jgi:hypothetical protein
MKIGREAGRGARAYVTHLSRQVEIRFDTFEDGRT